MYIADNGVPTKKYMEGKDGEGWGEYLQEWPAAPNGTGDKNVDGKL